MVVRNFHLERFISAGVPYLRTFNPATQSYEWGPSTPSPWFANYGQIISLILFAALCVYMYWDSHRAAPEEKGIKEL